MGIFTGKKGMVLGVANDFSIAWAITRKLLDEGAEIGFTHLPGDKMERRVRKLVDPTGAKLVTACDVQKDEDVARHAAKALNQGGSILTLTYLGGERVVPGYNMMGVCKAALDASVKYLAYDLGPKKIRVNAVSAGPVKTLAASAVGDFEDLAGLYVAVSPLGRNITREEVGSAGMFLLSDLA